MLSVIARSGCIRPIARQLAPSMSQVSHMSGSTVTHWKAERYVSILTVGAMMTAAVHPTLAVDHALAILVPLHTHWGLEQVFTDYIHIKPLIPIVGILLKVLTGFTMIALLYFNQHDIGITQAVKDVWNIKRVNPEELG
ncbi:hypothetical protein ACHWQZ_G012032 [Mnemiopsis leidyi]